MHDLVVANEMNELVTLLSTQQLAFANLVLEQPQTGLSRQEIFEAAGYKGKNRIQGYDKVLGNPNIAAYIHAMKIQATEKTGLTLEFLDGELMKLIKTSITDIVTTKAIVTDPMFPEKVTHVPVLRDSLDNLDKNATDSIHEIKMTNMGIQVKQYSKLDAMRLAYQRLGGLTEKRELTGANGGAIRTSVSVEWVEADECDS